MELPSKLLNQALAVYYEYLDRKQPEELALERQQLSAEIIPVLPKEVQDYLEVVTHQNGGHSFWLNIPGCVPISLSFTRRISCLELKLASVIGEETRKQRSFSSLILAIGYARNLYLTEK